MTLAHQSTKQLYVIGNGFDLWHGLPTSYKCFNKFAEDALAELESFYEINVGDEGPWCDFENNLGTFDWQSFYKAHDNTDVTAENFKPSEVYSLEDDLAEQADNHIEELKEQFREWIDEIDVSTVVRKMHFSENDRFLTFNYTSTLQLEPVINFWETGRKAEALRKPANEGRQGLWPGARSRATAA